MASAMIIHSNQSMTIQTINYEANLCSRSSNTECLKKRKAEDSSLVVVQPTASPSLAATSAFASTSNSGSSSVRSSDNKVALVGGSINTNSNTRSYIVDFEATLRNAAANGRNLKRPRLEYSSSSSSSSSPSSSISTPSYSQSPPSSSSSTAQTQPTNSAPNVTSERISGSATTGSIFMPMPGHTAVVSPSSTPSPLHNSKDKDNDRFGSGSGLDTVVMMSVDARESDNSEQRGGCATLGHHQDLKQRLNMNKDTGNENECQTPKDASPTSSITVVNKLQQHHRKGDNTSEDKTRDCSQITESESTITTEEEEVVVVGVVAVPKSALVVPSSPSPTLNARTTTRLTKNAFIIPMPPISSNSSSPFSIDMSSTSSPARPTPSPPVSPSPSPSPSMDQESDQEQEVEPTPPSRKLFLSRYQKFTSPLCPKNQPIWVRCPSPCGCYQPLPLQQTQVGPNGVACHSPTPSYSAIPLSSSSSSSSSTTTTSTAASRRQSLANRSSSPPHHHVRVHSLLQWILHRNHNFAVRKRHYEMAQAQAQAAQAALAKNGGELEFHPYIPIPHCVPGHGNGNHQNLSPYQSQASGSGSNVYGSNMDVDEDGEEDSSSDSSEGDGEYYDDDDYECYGEDVDAEGEDDEGYSSGEDCDGVHDNANSNANSKGQSNKSGWWEDGEGKVVPDSESESGTAGSGDPWRWYRPSNTATTTKRSHKSSRSSRKSKQGISEGLTLFDPYPMASSSSSSPTSPTSPTPSSPSPVSPSLATASPISPGPLSPPSPSPIIVPSSPALSTSSSTSSLNSPISPLSPVSPITPISKAPPAYTPRFFLTSTPSSPSSPSVDMKIPRACTPPPSREASPEIEVEFVQAKAGLSLLSSPLSITIPEPKPSSTPPALAMKTVSVSSS